METYESEARLENRMIDQLAKQGYSKVAINDVGELEQNFRKQVNIHNKIELKGKDLTDKEFERLMIKISGKSVFLIIYCSSMFKKMFAFFLLLIVVSAAFFRENCHFYTEK